MQRLFSFLIILILSTGPLRASDPAESLDALGGLVDTWTRLRTEIASEIREWAAQKEFLQAERDLLRQEADRLSEEIERFREFSNTEEEEREEALRTLDRLSAALADLEPVLSGLEARIRRESQRLPVSMRPDIEDWVSGFPKPDATESSGRVVDRMQAVASALVYLEDLHPRMQVTREMLEDGEGSRREMEVLYLGLAGAFAVSGSNDWAGVGRPTASGWSWTARPELTSAIRRAIDMNLQRSSADFVDLPFALIQVEDGE